MAEIIDFNIPLINQEEALNLIEDAIIYAASITQNQLIDTSINSPFRFLLEAQTYVYGEIIESLNVANNQLEEALYRILGYTIIPTSNARALLKFSLLQTYDLPVFIPRAFPVSSLSGILFLTDEILVLPAGSTVGYVDATAIISGEAGNVGANTINNPRQILSFNVLVTNESDASGGSSRQSLVNAQQDLATAIANTSVVNASNYEYQLSKLNPNYFCNVTSPSNFNLNIYVAKKDGISLLDSEINSLENHFNSIKHIGLENVNVLPIQLIPLFIEVVLAVEDVFSFNESRNIADTLRNYLIPGSATSKKYKGVVLVENLKRIINAYNFDYVQTLRIGTTLNNAVGNNFTYNENTESVFLRTCRVTLISDNTSIFEDFDYA